MADLAVRIDDRSRSKELHSIGLSSSLSPFGDSPKYEIERVLGRGGMGMVYEARHLRLGHRVAIKVLGEDLRAHPDLVTRFEREAHAAGALSSPHSVKIFDIDKTSEGTPFIVMELLAGSDLGKLLDHDGAPAIGTAVRWIIEACDAIGEAHRLGIVHRDIKPSNLFLCTETGSIKVLDFGIAKRASRSDVSITQGVAPLGTPQYMSPEQVRCAKEVDARTDIWSLGVTLYELLCGRPPYNHDIAQACIVAIVTDPIPDPREFRPDLPDELVAAILRALAKDATSRFSSVDELVLALAPFAEPAPVASDPLRAVSTARRTVARELTTVDGEPVLELRHRARDVRAEETPPPAVSPPRKREKRIRSTIALVAVIGALAAGAFVPRWLDAALADAPKVRTAIESVPPQQSTADDDAPLPPFIGPPASKEVTSASSSARARTSAAHAVGSSSSSARSSGSMPLVHGGISSPGF